MEPIYHRFSRSVLDENGRLIDFTVHCPENFNFAYDVVDAIAEEEPGRTALVWCDEQGREKIISFGEMAALSSQAAACLQRHGVRQGDCVMLMLKRHFEYWYTLLALHKLGAVAVPATHMLQTEDIAYRVERIGISAIVCADDDAMQERVLEAKTQCSYLQNLFTVRKDHPGFIRLDTEMKSEAPVFPRVNTRMTDPFLLYFTSGTTGHPKPVTHDYTYPLAHIVTAKYWQNAEDGGLHLTVSDTGWAKASWGKIYGQWLCGSAVMVYEYDRFVPQDLLAVIRSYGVTSFCAPPTVYRMIVKGGFCREDFTGVHYAATAGEKLNPSIIETFRQTTALLIREGFGQTETTLLIGNLVGDPVKIGSIGRPSPLYNIRLIKEDGTHCRPGETGEIVVLPREGHNAGLCISCGDERDRARAWVNGVYHTGDLATMDKDGHYWYVSRKDDMIKSSGYRIGPFEIENVLIRHPAVQECAVTGVPDEERGALVKASIVLCPGYSGSEMLAKELQTFVKEQTAPYKYPRIVEFVEELPKTISGKIRRAEIRQTDAAPVPVK